MGVRYFIKSKGCIFIVEVQLLVIERNRALLSYIAGDPVIFECNLDDGRPPPGSVIWL